MANADDSNVMAANISGESGRDTKAKDKNNMEHRTTKIEPSRKECVVCCTVAAIRRFPKYLHETAEPHDSDVCFDCWKLHLVEEVQRDGSDEPSCAECPRTLEECEIKAFATNEVYAKYLDKAAKKYQESHEEYRACPSATCTFACFFSTKEDGNIFICRACGHRYCVICEVNMHEGMTCGGFQQQIQNADRAEENKASERLVKETSKVCPNANCGARVVKVDGCDAMRCTRCEFRYCWQCGAPYEGPEGIRTRGNLAHKMTCPHHPGNLPDHPNTNTRQIEIQRLFQEERARIMAMRPEGIAFGRGGTVNAEPARGVPMLNGRGASVPAGRGLPQPVRGGRGATSSVGRAVGPALASGSGRGQPQPVGRGGLPTPTAGRGRGFAPHQRSGGVASVGRGGFTPVGRGGARAIGRGEALPTGRGESYW